MEGPFYGAERMRLSRPHLKAFVYRTTMKTGPRRLTRDIRIVQSLLVESGRAAWLGDGRPSPDAPPLRDLERAVARVRGLFEPAVTSQGVGAGATQPGGAFAR